MRATDAANILAIYQEGLDGGRRELRDHRADLGRVRRHQAAGAPVRGRRSVRRGGRFGGGEDRVPPGGQAGMVAPSVYVRPSAQGRGAGTALLRALVESTEAAGIWTIQSGVFPENTTSLALHAKAEFRGGRPDGSDAATAAGGTSRCSNVAALSLPSGHVASSRVRAAAPAQPVLRLAPAAAPARRGAGPAALDEPDDLLEEPTRHNYEYASSDGREADRTPLRGGPARSAAGSTPAGTPTAARR